MKTRIFLFLLLALLIRCQDNMRMQEEQPAAAPLSSYTPRWSKSFGINYFEDYKEIIYYNAAGKIAARYLLPKEGQQVLQREETDKGVICLPTTPRSVVTTSSTYIAVLDALHLLHCVKGVNEAPFICNQEIQQKIKQGKVVNLGGDGFFDIEKLLTLRTDVLFQSAYETEGSVTQQKIRESKIPCVLIRDYDEQHPLARAEWMIYIAAFFNQEKEADSLFSATEREYLDLRNRMDSCNLKRPLVLFNLPWNDVWYMPGKDAYMTRLIHDAGGRHPWEQEERNNSLNISLNYEQVFLKAATADFWLHPNSAGSLGEMSRLLPRAVHFSSFSSGNVYNNNLVRTAAGGNDFWETGVIFPQLLLKDLIAVFHPELMPGHELLYYQKLTP